MAEDTAKSASEELETMLGESANGVEAQEQSEKSIVEELIAEGGEGDSKPTGEGASAEAKPQNVKGDWRTSLPTELRDGIDTEKYHSVAEYIKGLKDEAKKAREPEPEPNEAWDSLTAELGAGSIADGELLDKSVLDSLKESGLSTKQAKAAYKAMQANVEKATGAKAQEFSEGLRAYQRSMAGDDAEKLKGFKATVKRGIDAASRNNPELFIKGKNDNVFLHPTVANLLFMIGQQEMEGNSPAGYGKHPDESGVSADNPFGLR